MDLDLRCRPCAVSVCSHCCSCSREAAVLLYSPLDARWLVSLAEIFLESRSGSFLRGAPSGLTKASFEDDLTTPPTSCTIFFGWILQEQMLVVTTQRYHNAADRQTSTPLSARVAAIRFTEPLTGKPCEIVYGRILNWHRAQRKALSARQQVRCVPLYFEPDNASFHFIRA